MNHQIEVYVFVFLRTRIVLFCALMTLLLMPSMIAGDSHVPIAVAQSIATNLATTVRNQANKSEHQRFRISGEIALEIDSTTTPTPEFKSEKRKRIVKDKRKAKK